MDVRTARRAGGRRAGRVRAARRRRRHRPLASGNVINSIFDESAYAQSRFGNGQDGLAVRSNKPVYVSGVEFRNKATAQYKASSDHELPAAPVNTQSVAAMEPNVHANAGAMPRDAIDQRYIELTNWSNGKRRPIRF